MKLSLFFLLLLNFFAYCSSSCRRSFVKPLLTLRGGMGRADEHLPRSGDAVVMHSSSKAHAVPGGCEVYDFLPLAVESALEGMSKRVLVRAGKHSWDSAKLIVGGWRADPANPYESLQEREASEVTKEITRDGKSPTEQTVSLVVQGEEGARMWGMWFLEPESTGNFTNVTCAVNASHDTSQCTIEVWGRGWKFTSCGIRSLQGTALKCSRWASINCSSCGIGGLGAGEKDEYGEWVMDKRFRTGGEQRAENGVEMRDVSRAALSDCVLEYTGLGSYAVQQHEDTRLRAEHCMIQGNSVGLFVDRNSLCEVYRCVFKDNDMGAFYAGPVAYNASMRLVGNRIYGKLWFSRRRPGGILVEEHHIDRNGPTFSNETEKERSERLLKEEHHGLDISDGSFKGHFDNLLELDAFNPLCLSATGESWKSLEDKLKETTLGGYNQVYAAARNIQKVVEDEETWKRGEIPPMTEEDAVNLLEANWQDNKAIEAWIYSQFREEGTRLPQQQQMDGSSETIEDDDQDIL